MASKESEKKLEEFNLRALKKIRQIRIDYLNSIFNGEDKKVACAILTLSDREFLDSEVINGCNVYVDYTKREITYSVDFLKEDGTTVRLNTVVEM